MTGFYMKCKTGMKWVQPPNGLNNTKIQREARVRERNTWLQEKGKVRRGSYIQKQRERLPNIHHFKKNSAFAVALKRDIVGFDLGTGGWAPNGQ